LDAGIRGAALEAQRLTGTPIDAWLTANRQAAAEVWSAISEGWILGGVGSADPSTRIYERTLELVGGRTDLAPELVRAHGVAARVALRCYDDVGPFLEAVAAHGSKIVLITNGASDTQRDTISAIGLDDAFDAAVVSAEVGVKKPDPRIFEAALAEIGASSVDAWHIGDSLESDVAGAIAAGLQPVWLNRLGVPSPENLSESVTTVRSLIDLIPFLTG
jgi:putative hydrolase of the HAD superfamily